MKTGLVGFFDILGYQNIINNNDIEKTATIISDIILKLPSTVQTELIDIFPKRHPIIQEDVKEYINESLPQIHSQIISDSIIITLPIDTKLHIFKQSISWMLFQYYSCMLLEAAFTTGLPLRGAIDFGEYYENKQCIAGKTIINSYKLSHQLEFSGCAFCEGAANAKNDITEPFLHEMFELFTINYLAPLKSDTEKKLHLLNWIVALTNPTGFDPRQYTIEAFHKHNKDVPMDAFRKINNTENILRYCLMVNKSRQSPDI